MVERASRSGARRPNFIIFLTDDQGYGDLSCEERWEREWRPHLNDTT